MTGFKQGAEQTIELKIENATLEGTLILPESAKGIILFAHGSGSSRFSPRNRQVADYLNNRHLATLLLDLLTIREHQRDELTREYRFDIPLLSRRLCGVVNWLAEQSPLNNLKIGLFGASTGAAAALICAAELPDRISALVSRGGRVDLAGEALENVKTPCLLIVGGYDKEVIVLNETAAERLHCHHSLAVVPAASHLFEEPDKLEEVCRLAGDWFVHYLSVAESEGSDFDDVC